jgi:copper amine oxidase-like protein/Big-like domain-containing protein
MQLKTVLKFIPATFILVALLGLPSLSAPSVQVVIDQQPMILDQPAVMQEGRVLVPLRGIFERLGAEVVYVASTRSIKATRDRTQVELQLGSRSARVDGRSVYLDVPAVSYGGRTMVPLRFISEALGADVDWQSASRTVSITSPSTSAQNPQPQPQPQPPAARMEIQSVLHSSTGTLRPGDQLTVTMLGDQGGQATFDVPGAFQNVAMREVRQGRYEGTVTVPNNLNAQRGTVVARLMGNGKESQMEASRSLIFEVAQNNNNNNNNGNNSYDLQPQPNSTVTQSRPSIEVQFDRAVDARTVRLSVDGQDVTSSANLYGSQVRYTPNYDLSAGQHQVYVSAQDNQGRSMQQQWSFNVDRYANNNNNNNNNNAYQTIQVSNLRDGMTVDRVFNVQGQTAPYASVRVTAQSTRQLIPGVLGVRGQSLERQGQANSNGRFDIQIDASSLGSNTSLALVIESTDSSGRSPSPVNLGLNLR